jgi:Na+-transporting NADH:ubiquinone oxidoreductase subunit NqrB
MRALEPGATKRAVAPFGAWDVRIGQIAVLSGLLVWNIVSLSLGAAIVPSLAAILGCLAAQVVATQFAGLPRLDLRSPLITGLSLALLLRTDALVLMAGAGILAIAGKFLIRYNGKHLFNPAALAIATLLWSGHGWVSPGQWGQSTILLAAILGCGLLVLERAGRLDTALAFGLLYAALLFARAFWLGDPWAVPLHQLQSGSLVLFACFMITDPRSTPDRRLARIVFAAAVAVLAFWLIFADQRPSGLYLALLAMSLPVPLLDRLFPASRFVWRPAREVAS